MGRRKNGNEEVIDTLTKKKRKLLVKALAEGKIKAVSKAEYQFPSELTAEGITPRDVHRFMRASGRK